MKITSAFLLLVSVLAFPTQLFAEASLSASGLLQTFVEKHELAGAVALVADKDKVLAVETVGFADIAGGKKMAADSVFWIASQSKPMTATAVMTLVDGGKICSMLRWRNTCRNSAGRWSLRKRTASTLCGANPHIPSPCARCSIT